MVGWWTELEWGQGTAQLLGLTLNPTMSQLRPSLPQVHCSALGMLAGVPDRSQAGLSLPPCHPHLSFSLSGMQWTVASSIGCGRDPDGGWRMACSYCVPEGVALALLSSQPRAPVAMTVSPGM